MKNYQPLVVLVAAALLAGTGQAAVYQVTSTSDNTTPVPTAGRDGTAANPYLADSLRAAVLAANANPGPDTIVFDPALNGNPLTLTLAGSDDEGLVGDLDVTDPLAIQGNGPANTVIQAGTTSANGIDKVLSLNPAGGLAGFSVSLSGMTIRHGRNTDSFSSYNGQGGGFDFDAGTNGSGTLLVSNCVITANSTTDGDGGGVALFNGGTVTIVDSTISGNTANSAGVAGVLGGGLFVGSSGFAAQLTVTNSAISGNRVLSGPVQQGGGLALFGPFGLGTTAYAIGDSSIIGNEAGSDGGGIHTTAPLIIDGTEISQNSSGRHGGGLWNNAAGTLSLAHSTVVGNRATSDGGGLYLSDATNATNRISFNRLAGNTAAGGSALYQLADTADAAHNWWGTNAPAPLIVGATDFSPWLVLTHTASPPKLPLMGATRLTAGFLTDSDSNPVNPADLTSLVGVPIAFGGAGGAISGAQTSIQPSGVATANFTAYAVPEPVVAMAAVDEETVPAMLSLIVADDQAIEGPENTPIPITLTGSGYQPGPANFTITAPPTNGVLSGVDGSGLLTNGLVYTPNLNYFGDDHFKFVVDDGAVTSAPALVSITLTNTYSPPLAPGQTNQTTEGQSVGIVLNAQSPEGLPLTYQINRSTRHGTITLAGDTVTYTPNPGFNGVDSFEYEVSDGTSNSVAIATIEVAYEDDVLPYAFDPAINIPTPTTPRAIAAGDFVKDYKQDLAVANMADNKVSILQGDGKGGFAAPIEVATGNRPVAVAKLDFNRDYRDDLAVLCAGDNVIQVFQQLPDKTLVLYANLPVDGPNPQGLIAADFNYDLYADLAVVNTDAGTVQVWMNDKAGGFNPPLSFAVGAQPLGIGAGPISWPDIKPEIVAANSADATASVLLGAGDGTFSLSTNLPAGDLPTAVAVADFNGDRKGDVVIANGGTDDITVYTNDGRGTLIAAGNFGVGFSVGFKPVALAAADFNKDKALDLAAVMENDNSVVLFLGSGTNSLGDTGRPLFSFFWGDPGAYLPVGNQPVAIAVADFNRDILPDLAVANFASDDVSILLNNYAPKAYRQLIKILEDNTHPITLGGSHGPLDYLITRYPAYTNTPAPSFTTTDATTSTTVNPTFWYTPSNHWYGWDKMTYYVDDSVRASRPADILIWVLPVNDPPGFAITNDVVTVDEDTFLYKYTNFVTKQTPVFGETFQYQKYILTPADPGLFRPIWGVPRIIGTDNQLWFTPPKNAFGSTSVDIYAFDYGGTANGGNPFSTYTNTFTINITPVNDAPKFLDLVPFKVGYEETPTNWTFRIADVDTPLDQLQVTVLSTNSALVDPADPTQVEIVQVVNAPNNWLEVTVTVTPAVDEFGKTALTFLVDDTQGGTVSKTAGYLVFGVNDAPSFDLVAGIDPINMQLGTGYYTKYTNVVVEPTSISKGPANESSQYLFFQVTASNPSLFILQPRINSSTGELSFWAKSPGMVTLDILLKDTGGTLWGGQNLSAVETITVNLNP